MACRWHAFRVWPWPQKTTFPAGSRKTYDQRDGFCRSAWLRYVTLEACSLFIGIVFPFPSSRAAVTHATRPALSSWSNAHRGKCRDSRGLSRLMPRWPARAMQPSVTACVGPKWQQRIARPLSAAASYASSGCGRRGVTVEPLRYAAGDCSSLGLRPRQSTIELGNTGPVVEEDLPILGGPTLIGRA
jgi:hypothetical protein